MYVITYADFSGMGFQTLWRKSNWIQNPRDWNLFPSKKPSMVITYKANNFGF